MNVIPAPLPGVLRFEPRIFADERGCLFESWSRDRYRNAGLTGEFVQDNVSYSRRGVLRGLHYQYPQAQGKLVQVLQGEVFDVAVDIRRRSPHFGSWYGCHLSDANRLQLYLPPGFAHGFLALSDLVVLAYKCTEFYQPGWETTVLWNDPAIGIAWPMDPTLISAKDRAGLLLSEVPPDRLPTSELVASGDGAEVEP